VSDEIILTDAPKPHRRNVQLTGMEKIVVLVHKDTNRILCFGRDDWMTKKLASNMGCKIIEVMSAHDYDKYAKAWREQSKIEDEIDDHLYLERENVTRQALRKQLRDKLALATSGPERQMIASALHTLDFMEEKRRRYRAESFMAQEAFEANKQAGQELIEQIMVPKDKPKE
jgi:hypothetical protein